MSVAPGPVRREHDEHVGRAREADVALGAGKEEPIAVRNRVELHAARPEAAVRLEPGRHKDRGTGRDLREPLLPLLNARGALEHAAAQHRAHEVRRRRERPTELLVDDRGVEHRHARATVHFRDREPEQPEVGQLRPERLGVADRIVLDLAHDGERCVLLAHPAHGLPQHLLFVGEVEIHRSPRATGARRRRAGSTGCRRRPRALRRVPCTRSPRCRPRSA